ncbi:MAG: hypothetical protein EOP10_10590 [Proteobacteria bacterium]|nr:MAG: hypothetical protein EOP10_10590 [Pseudomonadota bacterium]
MKSLSPLVLTLFFTACGLNPTDAKTSSVAAVEAIAPAEGELNMLGGRALTADKETGVGKMLPRGGDACTFTRVSQRHFLTAYHCLTKDGKAIFDKVNIVMQSAKSERLEASKEFGFDAQFAEGAFKPISGDGKNYLSLLAQIYNGYEDWVVFSLDHSKLETSADIYKYLNANYDIKPLAPKTNTYLFEQVGSVGWGENSMANDIIARCSTKRPITCSSDVLDNSKYDDAIGPAPVKSAKFRIDLIGRTTPSNAQGIIMHTRLSIPKDGIIRVPKSEVDWGILAPGDSGGPLLDSKNRLLGVNGSLYNNGDSLLGSWWALQLSTKINPDAVSKIINQVIVDSAKDQIVYDEAFAVFGYRLNSANAIVKSSGESLAKIACSPKELAGKEDAIALGGMVEGSDYVCFKGPSYKSLASDSITIEGAGNLKAAFRKVVSVKEAPRCDSSVTSYPVNMDGFILFTPFLKETYDVFQKGPIIMTLARKNWDRLNISKAILSGTQSAQSECWKYAPNGSDCEIAPSPGRLQYSGYGVSVEADTHTDATNAVSADLTTIIQAYKASQDYRDNRDIVVSIIPLKEYGEEYFVDKKLTITGCPAE